MCTHRFYELCHGCINAESVRENSQSVLLLFIHVTSTMLHSRQKVLPNENKKTGGLRIGKKKKILSKTKYVHDYCTIIDLLRTI